MGRKKEVENPQEFALGLSYSKSNRLINSRGRSTSLNLKVLALGLTRLKKAEDGSLVSEIPLQVLRAALGKYNGSFYDQIKDLVASTEHATIQSWTTFIEEIDPKTGSRKFVSRVLIPEASFTNGCLRLVYNPSCEGDLYSLQRNYTRLPLKNVLSMKSPYSIQMYERFKSAMDLENARTKKGNGPYFLEYSLSELKSILGLNAIKDQTGRTVQKEFFSRIDSFRTRVLDVIVSETTTCTDVKSDYQLIRQGSGGKVVGVRFVLYYQKVGEGAVPKKEEIIDEQAKEKAPSFNIMEAAELFGPDFSIQDVLAVCDAAGNDMDKVRKVCDMANSSGSHIKNKTGWMIQALREGWENVPGEEIPAKKKTARKGAPAKAGRKSAKNQFTDFEQNEYDFEELEKKLLNS